MRLGVRRDVAPEKDAGDGTGHEQESDPEVNRLAAEVGNRSGEAGEQDPGDARAGGLLWRGDESAQEQERRHEDPPAEAEQTRDEADANGEKEEQNGRRNTPAIRLCS